MQKALQQAEQAIEKAQQSKEAAAAQLAAEGQLRNLLFAKGEPLEAAVLQSLHLLGFKADRHVDDQLEIDAMFESEEGRFIGEVTGKENSPVDAIKLRQLSDNIFQDREENEVENPAKGILFGNAHRLEPPETRQEHFTKKCKALAKSYSIALVATKDLFPVAQYLSSHAEEAAKQDYARACREALASGSGEITFPAPPPASTKTRSPAKLSKASRH